MSDDEAAPRTLRERIAKLGLDQQQQQQQQQRQPPSRPGSTQTFYKTPEAATPRSNTGAHKPPPIAAKPQLLKTATMRPASSAENLHASGADHPVQAQSGHVDGDQDHVSVKDRVRGYIHAQTNPDAMDPFTNPFSTPVVQTSSPSPGQWASPTIIRRESVFERPPPPRPASSKPQVSGRSSSVPFSPAPESTTRSARPKPPPPPPPKPAGILPPHSAPATPLMPLPRTQSMSSVPPRLPPKPAGIKPTSGLPHDQHQHHHHQQQHRLTTVHEGSAPPSLPFAQSFAESNGIQTMSRARSQSTAVLGHMPPQQTLHSVGSSPQVAGYNGNSQLGDNLPPPPPPSANALKRASYAGGISTPHSNFPPPPPPPSQTYSRAPIHSVDLGMVSPLPGPAPPFASSQGTGSRGSPSPFGTAPAGRSGSAAAGSGTRTALDYSTDPALKPVQPDYRLLIRRPPSLGVQPVLGSDASSTAVRSCLGGRYAVIAHHTRVTCINVDTGTMSATHNLPAPEERFVAVAPVHSATDPAMECARIWASTSHGRVMVLNAQNTGEYLEIFDSCSHFGVIYMLPVGGGEVWTLKDDGIFEVWQDRSITGSDRPLTALRVFSIATELHIVKRHGLHVGFLLLYQRELWFSAGRNIWVYDTLMQADDPAQTPDVLAPRHQGSSSYVAAPRPVAHIMLTSNDSAITCITSNAMYLDEARIESHGYVFAGTETSHVIVFKAASYERFRTLDLGNGQGSTKITAMKCVSDRWVWVGFESGKIMVVDIGGDSGKGGVVRCPMGTFDVGGWAVVKEWTATEHSVVQIHVDWSPMLTERGRLQVASVHSNGSVYFWDGTLAMDWQSVELRKRTREFATVRDIGVQICSWNIDAIKPEALESSRNPEDREFLRTWLSAMGNSPEIVVVGLQEVVDLESKTMTAKSLWKGGVVGKHKSKSKSKLAKPSADISKRYGLWKTALERTLSDTGTKYRVVECQNMVGLFVCVFARDDVFRSIAHVGVAQVKTGLGGLHGNKGGIGVRFVFDDTSFCFVNAHLAAGESGKNNAARLGHARSIVRGMVFKKPSAEYQAVTVGQQSGILATSATGDLDNITLDSYIDGGDGRLYLDHAACFFSGDLNFRLRMPRVQAERYIDAGDLDALLQYDQLLPLISSDVAKAPVDPSLLYEDSTAAAAATTGADYSSGEEGDELAATDEKAGSAGFALRLFREQPIRFRPTYKYDPGTDRYDSSEKRRTPAWCDRVLFKGASGRASLATAEASGYDMQGHVTPVLYRRYEVKLSDHRPIVAGFRVTVKTIDRSQRRDVSLDVRRKYDARVLPGIVAFAKLLWLARFTANMTRAAELLSHAEGDLQRALQDMYHHK